MMALTTSRYAYTAWTQLLRIHNDDLMRRCAGPHNMDCEPTRWP